MPTDQHKDATDLAPIPGKLKERESPKEVLGEERLPDAAKAERSGHEGEVLTPGYTPYPPSFIHPRWRETVPGAQSQNHYRKEGSGYGK